MWKDDGGDEGKTPIPIPWITPGPSQAPHRTAPIPSQFGRQRQLLRACMRRAAKIKPEGRYRRAYTCQPAFSRFARWCELSMGKPLSGWSCDLTDMSHRFAPSGPVEGGRRKAEGEGVEAEIPCPSPVYTSNLLPTYVVVAKVELRCQLQFASMPS